MVLDSCRLMVAPLTPFDSSGQVALDLIERQAELLLARRAEGLYLAGNTGEGMLLTTEERMALAERWVAVLDERVPLVIHVGHGSVEDAKALAAHAQSIGAAAFSSVGPTLFSCKDIEALVNWSAAIAAAAPELPFFHYYTGPKPDLHPCRAEEYFIRAQEVIPNFAGLKFTNTDLLDFGQCLRRAGDRYRVLYGVDEAMLPALAMGAPAFIGGSYNLFSPLASQVIAAYENKQLSEARRVFTTMQRCIATLRKYGGLVALKGAMDAIGLPCGEPRLPMRPIDANQKTKLIAELEQHWPQMAGVAPDSVRLSVPR
jgi:N-acetylneuraminate lyase